MALVIQDANGSMVTRNGSTIVYASYNLPTSIGSGANSSTFSYDAWRNRSKQVSVTAGSTETTIYVAGLFEKVTRGSGGTTAEYRHWINATPGTVAIHTRRATYDVETYYLHRDHLGSGELITDAAGAPVVKLSFNANGERRDTDWDGPISSSDLATLANATRRGFTDHEHLDSVGLIHMNGRVYDPRIGRFLSRDPYIDGVHSSQGANGYAYVWNNPLTRWDPTGYGAEGPHVRNECNPDCPDTSSYGVGARLSNTFVTVVGVPVWSSEQSFEWTWIDGGWMENIIRTDMLQYLYSPSLVSGPLGGAPGGSTMPDGPLGGSGGESQTDPCKGLITRYPNQTGDLAVPVPGTGQGDPAFGIRPGGHWGLDLANDAHAPVSAAGNGAIFRQDFHNATGYGGQVVIDHGSSVFSQYGHLESFTLRRGSVVRAGDVIGRTAVPGVTPGAGNLGANMSPHVHFEIRLGSPLAESVGGNPIDPQLCLGGKGD